MDDRLLRRLYDNLSYFLEGIGVSQEDENYLINECFPMLEAWWQDPSNEVQGMILADWCLDQGREQLADVIRAEAFKRGNLGTGTG